jgi:hypothetical protein
VIRDNPVDLLWHPPVEASKTGFDVSHWNRKFRGCQRAGECGVRVSIDEHVIRPLLEEHLLDPREHCACLAAVRPRSNLEIHVRRRKVQAVEKDAGHLVVVVLSRVDEDLFMSLA